MLDTSRVAIENLRSGVPGPEVVALLTAGREGLLESVEEEWDALQEAEHRRTKNFRVVAANYGDGKSHALYAIMHRALSRNWVTTLTTVSREAPLDKPDRVYRKVIARTRIPGTDRSGIGALLDRIADSEELAYKALHRLRDHVHPKILSALEVRLLHPGSGQETIDEDLAGFFRSTTEIRSLYREVMGQRPQKTDRFRNALDAVDYFKMVDTLVTVAGFGGWVILFDEVELIGSLSRRSRALSYATMSRLLDPTFLPHTYTVWALASNFRQDLIARYQEADTMPQWARAHRLADIADKLLDPIEVLGSARILQPISEADLRGVMAQVVAAHASAYGWAPPVTGESLLQAIRRQLPMDVKVRQLVRAAVQYLDSTFLGGKEPTLRLDALSEPTVTSGETDASEGGGTDTDLSTEEGVEEGVREDRVPNSTPAVTRIWPEP